MLYIRPIRKAKGLSQVKLAAMAGIDTATLIRIERGQGNPNLETLRKIAKAMYVSVADLLPPEDAQLNVYKGT